LEDSWATSLGVSSQQLEEHGILSHYPFDLLPVLSVDIHRNKLSKVKSPGKTRAFLLHTLSKYRMLQTIHSLSSVQINLPKSLANKIIEWGHDHIPDSDLYEEPGKGREDEMHVTVLYGIKGDCASTVKSILKNQESFTIELGSVSLFTNPEFDVVKIEAYSHDLVEMNKLLRRKIDYVEKFPYRPHVTIAYLHKGKGWKHEGADAFEGKLFQADTVLFSSRTGAKSDIPLR
jgi:2'-5' RNA ligase